jgi:hypothetical protein
VASAGGRLRGPGCGTGGAGRLAERVRRTRRLRRALDTGRGPI